MTLVAERIIESGPTPSRLDHLAALARQGDTAALHDLLRLIRPLIYRWAWMQTADADDAEDVSQAVLLRVHRNIERFDGRSTISTWLYRITINACIELQRRKSSWRKLREKWSGNAHATSGIMPDAVDAISADRTRNMVVQMMTVLSTQQRAALDLVDLQGYEPIEAARMMDMNPATLRTHLLRGRKAIRSALMKENHE